MDFERRTAALCQLGRRPDTTLVAGRIHVDARLLPGKRISVVRQTSSRVSDNIKPCILER